MIDYARLNEPGYLDSVVLEIGKVNEPLVLSNLLKLLSIKMAYKEVAPEHASRILTALKTRSKNLQDIRRYNKNRPIYPPYNDWDSSGGTTNSIDNNQEKKLALHPTSVSNHRGSASLIFIIVGVAATAVMYTLLWIASILK